MDRQKRKTLLVPSLILACFLLTTIQFLGQISPELFVLFYVLELILGCWALLEMRGWRVSVFVKIGLAILLLPGVGIALWWFGAMFYFFSFFSF